jgi:predicted metal-dependent phosphoesterase TrpH
MADVGTIDGTRGTTDEGARFDLHSHSTYSDGSCTVEELIGQARAAGLAGLAITDHDTIAKLTSVRSTARRLGFPVLAGCEVSAFDPATGHKAHILAFGLEATPDGSSPLERLMGPTLVARTANTLWQTWTLGRAGISFNGQRPDLDEVCRVAGESTGVYKQHLMQQMTGLPRADAAYAEVYQRWLKGDGVAARDIAYPAATDAVRAIREQGGIPVLAHPGQMDNWSCIGELVAAGLMGIEAHHPDHTSDDVERARAAAAEHGLFVTGGSDYHGRYGIPAALGVRSVTAAEAGPRVQELFEREATLG